MPYHATISRQTPACILFLLDQSGSMNECFEAPGEPPIPKAQGVADAVNRLLGDLVLSCTQGAEVLDRFHVGVITYDGDGARMAEGFPGMRSLSEVAMNPLRLEERVKEGYDGMGGIQKTVVRFPIWFVPQADGGTPMVEALTLARSILDPWAQAHPDSFPPIIFNISDGASTDGDPRQAMEALKRVATQDGQALVFNLLLAEDGGQRLAYPVEAGEVPEGHLRSLVEGSSILPEPMVRRGVSQHELTLRTGARGVVLNARVLDVVKLLDIGSRPANA